MKSSRYDMSTKQDSEHDHRPPAFETALSQQQQKLREQQNHQQEHQNEENKKVTGSQNVIGSSPIRNESKAAGDDCQNLQRYMAQGARPKVFSSRQFYPQSSVNQIVRSIYDSRVHSSNTGFESTENGTESTQAQRTERLPTTSNATSKTYAESGLSSHSIDGKDEVMQNQMSALYEFDKEQTDCINQQFNPPSGSYLEPARLEDSPQHQPLTLEQVLLNIEHEKQSKLSRTQDFGKVTSYDLPPPSYSECMRHMDNRRQEQALVDGGGGQEEGPKGDIGHQLSQGDAEHKTEKAKGQTRFNNVRYPMTKYSDFRHAYEGDVGKPWRHKIAIVREHSPSRESDIIVSSTDYSDHQFIAFVSCLVCWPIGLMAIYYSNLAHVMRSEGKVDQATAYSKMAFIVSIVALAAGAMTYASMFAYKRSFLLTSI